MYCLLVVIAVGVAGEITPADYCKLVSANMPCRFDCAAPSVCIENPYNHTNATLTPSQQSVVLSEHNRLRQRFAQEFRPRSMRRLPMSILSYDLECQFFAECALRQCKRQPDSHMRALDGVLMRQNIFRQFDLRIEEEADVERVLSTAVRHWFSHYKLVNKTYWITGHVIRQKGVADYWQVVWPHTQYVGCAYLQTFDRIRRDVVWVYCTYKPRLDIEQVYMYLKEDFVHQWRDQGATERAEPMKDCVPNEVYPELCGNERVNDDFWINLTRASRANRNQVNHFESFILLSLPFIMIFNFKQCD